MLTETKLKAYFKILSIKKLNLICFTQMVFKLVVHRSFTTENIKMLKISGFFQNSLTPGFCLSC